MKNFKPPIWLSLPAGVGENVRSPKAQQNCSPIFLGGGRIPCRPFIRWYIGQRQFLIAGKYFINGWQGFIGDIFHAFSFLGGILMTTRSMWAGFPIVRGRGGGVWGVLPNPMIFLTPPPPPHQSWWPLCGVHPPLKNEAPHWKVKPPSRKWFLERKKIGNSH